MSSTIDTAAPRRRHPWRRFAPDEAAQIEALRLAGHTLGQIERITGRRKSSVRHCLVMLAERAEQEDAA